MGTRGAYELATALDAVEVPATVQALLAARIDRLGERDKQLLYTAAVIGKEFPRPLLESVIEIGAADLDAALAAVLTAELVYERAIYPVAEYAFKHPLTHPLGAQLVEASIGWASRTPETLEHRAGVARHHRTAQLLRDREGVLGERTGVRHDAPSSATSAFASFRSRVSKPSVNQS